MAITEIVRCINFLLVGWLIIVMISWWSGLLVEDTEVPGGNRQSVASH